MKSMKGKGCPSFRDLTNIRCVCVAEDAQSLPWCQCTCVTFIYLLPLFNDCSDTRDRPKTHETQEKERKKNCSCFCTFSTQQQHNMVSGGYVQILFRCWMGRLNIWLNIWWTNIFWENDELQLIVVHLTSVELPCGVSADMDSWINVQRLIYQHWHKHHQLHR